MADQKVNQTLFNKVPPAWEFDAQIGPFIRGLLEQINQLRARTGGNVDAVNQINEITNNNTTIIEQITNLSVANMVSSSNQSILNKRILSLEASIVSIRSENKHLRNVILTQSKQNNKSEDALRMAIRAR